MNGEELKREIRNAYYNDDMYSRYDLVDAVEDIVNENDRLREFIYDLIIDEERGHNDDVTFRDHVIRAHEYGIAQEIGVY